MKALVRNSALTLALVVGGGIAAETARAQEADLVAEVRTHLRQMETARVSNQLGKGPRIYSAALGRIVPAHERMLATFVNECAGMQGAAGNPEHDALVEAVRRDLTRLPTLSTPQLDAFVPGHAWRVRRLIRAHDAASAG